ncbi:hypothetical protein ACTID9_23065 [Brevibacillus fluminis]|uniref:hypothetical protein n=1 Tax=Brevibacillus fluminis TaxID=511487 RepID=UPI003F8BE0BC
MFLISIITLVTVPFFRKWLPREETRPGSFDFPGAVLLAGTVASFMLCITRWNGWFLLVSLLLLVLFTVRMRTAAQPFLQLPLLANAPYRSALITCFLVSGASFAILLVTPMMLHNVAGLETGMMGLVMFPGR